MALLSQWTWVWVNSGSWWWTGRPGVLQSMGSQRVRHGWATELNWTDIYIHIYIFLFNIKKTLRGVTNISLTNIKKKIFSFHCPVNYLPPLWHSTPALLLLSPGWHKSLSCLTLWEPLMSSWGSHTYVIKFVSLLYRLMSI